MVVVAVGLRFDHRRAVAAAGPRDGLDGRLVHGERRPSRRRSRPACRSRRRDRRCRRSPWPCRSACTRRTRLCSQTNTTGRCSAHAMLAASWNAPMFVAASPKNATATWSVPRGTVAEPGADGDRHAGADDAVGAEHAEGEVVDVHRSALAAAVTGGLAHQLGHHPREVAALGDEMSVATVGRCDVVVDPVGSHTLTPTASWPT